MFPHGLADYKMLPAFVNGNKSCHPYTAYQLVYATEATLGARGGCVYCACTFGLVCVLVLGHIVGHVMVAALTHHVQPYSPASMEELKLQDQARKDCALQAEGDVCCQHRRGS